MRTLVRVSQVVRVSLRVLERKGVCVSVYVCRYVYVDACVCVCVRVCRRPICIPRLKRSLLICMHCYTNKSYVCVCACIHTYA